MKKLCRRDRIHALFRGMERLDTHYHDEAWRNLAIRLEALSEHPAPKFEHLYVAIRGATLHGFDCRRKEMRRVKDPK